MCFQGLGEKEKTVESEVLTLVKRLKVRFGRSRRCEAPEVNNSRRGPGRRADLSKQGIVVVALAGSEAELSLTQDPELGPGCDGNHIVAILFQPFNQLGAEAAIVDEYQPGATTGYFARWWRRRYRAFPRRKVKPIVYVRRPGGQSVPEDVAGPVAVLPAGVWGWNPVALALERISGQGNTMALFMHVESRPIHRCSREPQLPQSRNQELHVRTDFLWMSEGGKHNRPSRLLAVSHNRCGQRPARTDFQQDLLGFLEEFLQAFGKTHGLAGVPAPVMRICRLGRFDPRAGQVGQVFDLRRFQAYFPHPIGEGLKEGGHHLGMKGMGSFQPAALHSSLGKQVLQSCHCVIGT